MPVAQIKVDFLEKELIEKKAKMLMLGYQKKSSETFPVDPEAILWDYLNPEEGVWLDNECDLGIDKETREPILGMTIPQKKEIKIDASLKNQEGRYRFTLAHEIGHWVLHSSLLLVPKGQRTFFNNEIVEFLSLNHNIFPKASHSKLPPEEWQANRFAAYLLIDADILSREFIKRFGKEPHDYRVLKEKCEIDNHFCSMREYSRDIAKTAVMGLQSLADLFVVSVEAMAIRIEEVGMIYESPKYSLFSL